MGKDELCWLTEAVSTGSASGMQFIGILPREDLAPTRVQDAYNLAWKVAYVEKGLASRSLLDTYTAERQPLYSLETSLSASRKRSLLARPAALACLSSAKANGSAAGGRVLRAS